MKTIFETISDIIDNSPGQVSACFQLPDHTIEDIFQAGFYHGLFKKENNGLDDRKNSVYGLIGTLSDLKKAY